MRCSTSGIPAVVTPTLSLKGEGANQRTPVNLYVLPILDESLEYFGVAVGALIYNK